MSEEVTLTVYFNDGNHQSFAFDRQSAETANLQALFDKLLDQKLLMLQVDDGVMAIPFSSIKYFHISPAPQILPVTVVKGAQFIN
jgi:hypothetical protein